MASRPGRNCGRPACSCSQCVFDARDQYSHGHKPHVASRAPLPACIMAGGRPDEALSHRHGAWRVSTRAYGCLARSARLARWFPHRSSRPCRVRFSQRRSGTSANRHCCGARTRRWCRIRRGSSIHHARARRVRDRDNLTRPRRPSVSAAGHAAEHASAARVWLNSARVWLARFPLCLIQLAMRIAVGAVFFNSGLLKINSWEFAIKLFQDEYKVPLLDPVWAARLATFNELSFSVLLIVGLATRIATLPLLGMIAVIQTFVYPQAWTEHLLWASILVFLLTRGPGELSLDSGRTMGSQARAIAHLNSAT